MNEDIEVRVAKVEERCKSNTHRLDSMEKKQEEQSELISSVKLLADRMERTTDDVQEIKKDVKEMKEKPAKRWDGVVDKIIYALIGAFAAWLMSGGAM